MDKDLQSTSASQREPCVYDNDWRLQRTECYSSNICNYSQQLPAVLQLLFDCRTICLFSYQTKSEV